MDWLLKHKLATVILVFAIVAAAWYLMSDSSSSSSAVLTSESAAAVPPDAQKLVQSLDQLHSVSLSSTIFTDPGFQALQDYSTPVVPENVGRPDPFAPLSATATSSAPASRSKP